MHSGTDFYAAWSDTVYSTGHGKIVGSGWNFGYGRQIKISHCSGYESSYAHLYKLFVKVGEPKGNDSNSSEDISEKISVLLSDRQLRGDISKKSREHIYKMFDTNKIVDDNINFYKLIS